jgi:hypothetical protein
MDIREVIRKHSKLSMGVVAILAAGAVYYAYVGTNDTSLAGNGDTYFSKDQGQSFFRDSGTKLGAYEHANPPVYHAIVASCDGGSHRFVAYLVRTPPSLLKQIDDVETQIKTLPANTPGDVSLKLGQKRDDLNFQAAKGMEVLRPGSEGKWVSIATAEGLDIQQNIKPPAGVQGTPTIVSP